MIESQIQPEQPVQAKRKQGFATMLPEQQRMLASKGGKAAHAKGTAHKWTSETAKEAGRKARNTKQNSTL